eukprot:TRINITY_DN4116_c0_g1_i1.p1 TRINITY_DN4116_c0_g1~~TRINITY_DN4116_c0_g1_i1.p1  ORF type:complete len:298 (-),score=14.82 TRINITY_DN4116_c0_g1_i1:162-1055(-)
MSPSLFWVLLSSIIQVECSQSSIYYFLWTLGNPSQAEILGSRGTVSNYFNPEFLTIFLVHGYRDVGDTNWILRSKDEYLKKGRCNVISLDWREIAAENYISSVWNLKDVASQGVNFLRNLRNPRYPGHVISGRLHPVGFSLGAHIVGIMGKMMNRSIPRITGLDPARPILEILPSSWKLDRKSAPIVDVMHGAGHYISMNYRVGTVDFYPNGGTAPQPGCKDEPMNLVCSHVRTADLFVESINSPVGFKSRKCGSWGLYQMGLCKRNQINWMGEPMDPNKKGTFFLVTRSSPPYAIP